MGYLISSNSFRIDGGPGSGNFGHSGRPGQVGGSGGGGGSSTTSKSHGESETINMVKARYGHDKKLMRKFNSGYALFLADTRLQQPSEEQLKENIANYQKKADYAEKASNADLAVREHCYVAVYEKALDERRLVEESGDTYKRFEEYYMGDNYKYNEKDAADLAASCIADGDESLKNGDRESAAAGYAEAYAIYKRIQYETDKRYK